MVLLRRILNDDVQLVRVYHNTVLTTQRISLILQKAYHNKMYARFYTDKLFIQINFARNGDISVSSNIRSQAFLADYYRKSKQGWTFQNVKAFVYQWMQVSRRTLY